MSEETYAISPSYSLSAGGEGKGEVDPAARPERISKSDSPPLSAFHCGEGQGEVSTPLFSIHHSAFTTVHSTRDRAPSYPRLSPYTFRQPRHGAHTPKGFKVPSHKAVSGIAPVANPTQRRIEC